MAQETQTGALYQPRGVGWGRRWEVVSKGRGYMYIFLASLVAQRLKHLPTTQETWVQSLGPEDPPGEGTGNPLQYSCLENSIDRGAWRL